MRSQVRFVMHPDDESDIVAELLCDPAVLLIDGPRWKTATPPTTRTISAVGNYCIIWSAEDLQELPAEFMPLCNDWYCRAEYATIQFLRSGLAKTVITEGRFAISTVMASETTAANVERRYKLLRRIIQKTYRNSVVRWRAPDTRQIVPEPDRSVWVGPAAMSWLAGDAARHIKQFLNGGAEGIVDERSIARSGE
jgi:hypothetical protein